MAAPQIRIPISNRVPVIDGTLSAREWDGSVELNTFVRTNNKGFEPKKTRTFITYDQENLYIAVQSQVKEGDQLIELATSAKKRDGSVWTDDAVEIYIKPPDAPLFVLMCNSIGTVYDSRGGDKDWNGNWKIANKVEFPWWTFECSISFKELGIRPPAPRKPWRMNICRDWQNPRQFTSLADMSTFSDLDQMPIFRFDPTVNPYRISFDVEKIALLQADLKASVYNKSTRTANVNCSLYLGGEKSKQTLIGRKKIHVPSHSGKEGFLTKNLAKYNIGEYGDKIGIRFADVDKTIFRADYHLTTYPPIVVSVFPLPAKKALLYKIDLTGLKTSLDEVILDCIVKDFEGRTVKEWQEKDLKNKVNSGLVAWGSIEAEKEYQLFVSVRNILNPSEIIEKEQVSFSFPGPAPWDNTTAGLTDKVPAPWTPLKYEGRKISVWGREYLFSQTGFPQKIFSQGQNLLSGAVVPFIKVNNAVVDLSDMKLEYTARTDPKAEFVSVKNSSEYTLKISGVLEYDGYLKYKVQLLPKKPITVSAFYLRIPLAKEHSEFVHINSGSYATIGKTSEHCGNCEFAPQILFCSDARALAWFSESNEYYRPSYSDKLLQIYSRGPSNILRVNFIQVPTRVAKEYTYEFGFQAAPLRPMPEGWRNWVHQSENPTEDTTIFQRWSWSNWYGFLRPLNPTWDKNLITRLRKKHPHLRITPYMSPELIATQAPEYKYYAQTWMTKPQVDYIAFGGGQYGGPFIRACMGSKSWRDFWFYHLDRYVSEYHINGIYWDSIDPTICMNENHGCGSFIDERGVRRAYVDWDGPREFAKRCYVILKQKEPDAIIVSHSSQRRWLPLLSFSDAVYDGEQFLSVATNTPNYCKFLKEDYYRALYGTQFGVVPIFLPAFYHNKKKVMKTQTPTESIYAYSLPYNVLVDSNRINTTISDQVQKIKKDFNLTNVDYVAPYDTKLKSIIDVQEKDAYTEENLRIGIYARKGAMLLAVSNLGGKKMTCHICPKINAYIGSENPMVQDERKQAKIDRNSSWYPIKIDPYDFTLISIKTKDSRAEKTE